ncbi:MAG: Mov34/MPN/PAD-1 family protein [Rhizomicrobium sp.]
MTALAIGTLAAAVRAARAAWPNEICGLLVGRPRAAALSIRLTAGSANTPLSFRIADGEIAQVERSLEGSGEIVRGCFHSHVFGRAMPSRRDAAGAVHRGELWLIYSLRERRLRLFEWTGSAFHRRHLRIVRDRRGGGTGLGSR